VLPLTILRYPPFTRREDEAYGMMFLCLLLTLFGVGYFGLVVMLAGRRLVPLVIRRHRVALYVVRQMDHNDKE